MIQFVENLNALGRWLFVHFGRISIEVAILAAIVGAAILALRIKRPAIRYAFWALVLIKPAIGLLATSPVSLYWYLQPKPMPEPTPIVMPAAPPMARPPMRPVGPVAPVMPPTRPPTVAPRPVLTPPPPPPEPTAWETFNIYGVGCAVWLAGVFILFVRLVVGFAYVGFLRQSSRQQKVGVLAEAVADLRRELKIRRRVRVAVPYVAHGPVLAGIVRPTILIPNDLAEDLSQEQARLIVGHELAHVKRRDNLVLLFQRIIEVFFFFHPVIWLTGWLMRREAEAAADDKIISIGGRPADYADALARAAEVRIGLTRRMLVNTFAASESDHARRVRRILNGRVVKTSLAMGVVAVIALIIIAIVGLPGPAERKPDTRPEGDNAMVSHIKTPEELALAVQREGSKVWIEGVPNMPVGPGNEWDGLLKGLHLLMTHRGEDVTLEQLMALSGDAFHLCFGTTWEERTVLKMPTEPLGNAARAMGYEYRWTEGPANDRAFGQMTPEVREATAQQYLQEVHSQIDAGLPVLFGGVYGQCGDWRAAVGYDPAEELICYVGGDDPYDWTKVYDAKVREIGWWDAQVRGTVRPDFTGDWIGNAAFLLGAKTRDVPEAEQIVTALRRAVELHHAQTYDDGHSAFYFGARAYERWSSDLHDLDYPGNIAQLREAKSLSYDFTIMMYLADQIVRGRSAAAAFCERAARLWPSAKDHLLAAAKAYREEATLAQEAFGVFLTGSEAEREAWLSDEAEREAGVTAIAQMLEKDELAVRHIQAALAAASAAAVAPVARPMEYGFRVDPMTWVENAEGLDAALVRRDVFNAATEADDALIAAEIERLLAETAADTARENHGPLIAALRLGCDPDRPEVKTAAGEYVRKALDERGALSRGSLTLALLTGWSEGDEPLKSLQALIDMPLNDDWDPWTPAISMKSLVARQDRADAREGIGRWMQALDAGMDATGCWNDNDVWDLLIPLSRVDDPRIRGIIARYIPALLRTQGPDGGWGDKSPQVFAALARHGLLDELRERPPLPPDWRVVRAIPAPEGELRTLTWDGSRFWVLDTEARQAIAISPDDGRELRRLDLDLKSAHGLGWYDGLLAVMAGHFLDADDPARVVLIDDDRDRVVKVLPFTDHIWGPRGAVQIGRLLWASQGCWITTMDVATGQCKSRFGRTRGAWPLDLTYDGQAIWSTDTLVPGLFRYDTNGRLLDFAEMPFFESFQTFGGDAGLPVAGITHTDEGLWVLSPSTGQIALIERIGPAFAAAAPAPGAAEIPVAGSGQPIQAVQSTPVFDIPKLADLDANGWPDSWGEGGFRVDVMTPFGPRRSTGEFRARFRLGWNETGLWLLATVTDDEFHSAESVEKLWANEADLILLYVIPERGKFLRVVIEPGMTDDWPLWRVLRGPRIGGDDTEEYVRLPISNQIIPPDDVWVGREEIVGGYVLQAVVPWELLGIEPAAGAELRAQVIVLDVDGVGEDIQMGGALWYPAIGTQGDTHISHRLRLADRPSAPQAAVVEADDDRITVMAAPEQVGKSVTVVEGDRTLAEATLAVDDATGYAVASIPLPLPPLSSPIAQATVMLDGQAIAALSSLQLYLDNYAGRGHNYDTLSMALVAAAKALGRDADFETVVCLSSNAFAPMLDTGETCTAWWMCQAWQADRCIETVAGRLGLSIRRLDLPEQEGSWDDPDAMAAHRRKIAPILREVMAGGEIIVTTGGWEAWQEHGLVPWCWAGIITEARDDGTILGAFVNGRTDNVIYHAYTMYAISPAEPTLSAHDADLIMLQQAVNRIRSTARFESDELSRYGLAAMDVWIEQMRKVPYCDPCHESQPDTGPTGCAYSSASPVYSGAELAAGYLRRRIGTFNVEARTHIEAAARHYDRIYLLLHPAMTGQGGRNYSRIIANQQLQNTHADNVLVPVRTHLAAAADAMARALAAEGVDVAAAPPTELDDPVAALTEEFTAEQLTQLAGWSSLYGNLEVVLREAAKNPQLVELLRQRLALGAISGEAATIRGYIGRLEPAEDTYLTHVENILQAIAAGQWGDDDQPFFMPGREARLEVLRGILADWVDGVSEVDALAAHDDDATVERIYGLLGEHTAAKAEAVTGLVDKFTPDSDCGEEFYEWEQMEDPQTIAQKMAHHITMLDKPLWHLEYSLSVTLAGIGHGESIGDWRTPGGHLGWKGWINPQDLPRVKTIAAALEAWLGDGDAQGEVAEIVAMLGERDAYREKVWLAGCLLHYLRTNGGRSDQFVEQLETDWLPLGPEGFTMAELTDSLVTGDIRWYWPRLVD